MTYGKSDPSDLMALRLCREFGFEPHDCVPSDERRCLGYEGDYYLNWARDKVEEAAAIRRALADGEKGE